MKIKAGKRHGGKPHFVAKWARRREKKALLVTQ
jgi:hypothetical protein